MPRRNFKKEIGEGNFFIVPKGLWERPGTLNFALNPGSQKTNKIIGDQTELPEGCTLLQIEVTSINVVLFGDLHSIAPRVSGCLRNLTIAAGPY